MLYTKLASSAAQKASKKADSLPGQILDNAHTYSRVVTPPSLLGPPLFSAKLLLRVTFCSLIRPPTYTCTHVFGLLLPQYLL